jgi:hypothetical protein
MERLQKHKKKRRMDGKGFKSKIQNCLETIYIPLQNGYSSDLFF